MHRCTGCLPLPLALIIFILRNHGQSSERPICFWCLLEDIKIFERKKRALSLFWTTSMYDYSRTVVPTVRIYVYVHFETFNRCLIIKKIHKNLCMSMLHFFYNHSTAVSWYFISTIYISSYCYIFTFRILSSKLKPFS